jgi:hypothetical protein
MQVEAEEDYTKPTEEQNLNSNLYARARLQFVRKVYAILTRMPEV